MIWLLDGNVLVAMSLPNHPHHERVHRWLSHLNQEDRIASCPVTEGTLLRIHMRYASDTSAIAAWDTLKALIAHPRHVSWELNFSYQEVLCERLTKPSQLTDAWLAELARRQGGRVASLDIEFSVLHDDVVTLVPV